MKRQTIKWVNSAEITEPLLKKWMAMLEEYPRGSLIKNVHTEVKCVSLSNKFYFPVTINRAEWQNSYVVSPYNAYILYAEEELIRKIKNKAVILCLIPIIRLLGAYLRWTSINKVVHINNFMLSTNPYPEWNGEKIDEIRDFIKMQYPEHTIIFRSLNDQQHGSILSEAEKNNFINIASRQVYMDDLSYKEWYKCNNNYQDKRKVRKQGLIYVDHEEMAGYINDAWFLYNKLYLEKYSQHNPQFSLAYFKHCHQQRLMYFQGYKNSSNELRAFAGLFVHGGTITSPLVGYDTHAPQHEGLYIHAIQLIYIHKFKTSFVLNLSSGAPDFKRLRGAKPFIEYSSMYCAHLKLKTRIMIRILAFVSNRIGKPLLKRYEL